MPADSKEKLSQIFRIVLDLDAATDPASIRRITEHRWDSLASVTLVAALESEFGITLDATEIERLTSYKAALLILEEKQV